MRSNRLSYSPLRVTAASLDAASTLGGWAAICGGSPRRIYEQLLPELKKLPMLKGLPEEEFPTSADVTDERYEMEVWMKNGRVTRAEFNLS